MTEAILGMEFLEQEHATINTRSRLFQTQNMLLPFKEKNETHGQEFDKNTIDKLTCLKLQVSSVPNSMQHPYLSKCTGMVKLSVERHHIPLLDTIPINIKPYPIAYKLLAATKDKINRLLALGIIRIRRSAYASPAFPPIKRDNTVRLVVDYRQLNSKTISAGYQFPQLMDQLRQLKSATCFSQLDMNCGYYQVPIEEIYIQKTAFVVPLGLYEILRMPFGLCDTPRTFQRTMNKILGHLPLVRVFLDDVLVFGHNEDMHKAHLYQVFSHLEAANATLNVEKCKFFQPEVDYLGHIVNSTGIWPADRGISSLKAIKCPTTPREVRKLLGLINWFRPYLPNLSTRIGSINDKLKKIRKKIIWTTEDTEPSIL